MGDCDPPELELKLSDIPDTNHYAVVVHPYEPRVLLLRKQEGSWSLPDWTTSFSSGWGNYDSVSSFLKEIWGMDTVTLRYLGRFQTEEMVPFTPVHEVEYHSSNLALPANRRWVNRIELEHLTLAEPQTLTYIQNSLRELEEGYPTQRRAWARRGWFDQAKIWIEQTLNRLGYGPVEDLVQIRTWERSTLWRIRAGGSNLYFKAIPAIFWPELIIPQVMSETLPNNFPQVLAINQEQGWFLMAEFGGTSLALKENPGIEKWQAALRQLANIQIASIKQVPILRERGCVEHSLENLSAEIPEFLNELEPYLKAPWFTYPSNLVQELQSWIPQLQKHCSELAAYKLPLTIEHGDLWFRNIFATRNGDFLFSDWSYATLSHPFFSVAIPLFEVYNFRMGVDAYNKLLNSYLEPWQNYLPGQDLRTAFKKVRTLALFHHAIYHHRHVLPNLEPSWQMTYFVQLCLDILL